MNPNVITIYKNLGETPLAALDRLRVEQPQYADATLSYIGRLDPMAEGDMLVLVGEENKNREAYLGLDKEYVFEVLFGIATDTQDILGLVTENAIADFVTKEMIEEKLKLFLGKRDQLYPAYSSKPVDGPTPDGTGRVNKPLHMWAREGRLEEIKMPTKEIEIYSISFEGARMIEKGDLAELIKERIALVKGDFRQAEILTRWEKTFVETTQDSFQVAEIKVHCSSGTYVRSITEGLGGVLNIPALALSIKRTRIDIQ